MYLIDIKEYMPLERASIYKRDVRSVNVIILTSIVSQHLLRDTDLDIHFSSAAVTNIQIHSSNMMYSVRPKSIHIGRCSPNVLEVNPEKPHWSVKLD